MSSWFCERKQKNKKEAYLGAKWKNASAHVQTYKISMKKKKKKKFKNHSRMRTNIYFLSFNLCFYLGLIVAHILAAFSSYPNKHI